LSDFKATFILKQHTPIIHFQSGQSGATLRATELKPKLDKFLIGMDKNLKTIKNASGHHSLDYKVKIVAAGTQARDIETLDHRGRPQKDPLFFGTLGGAVDKKFITAPTVSIEFFSFDKKTIEAIKTHFEGFLAQTNFGTRQSKGYGCFYLDKPFNKTLIGHRVYSFQSTNWKNDIKLLYSFLRQGINYPNRFYSKPAIFSYMLSKNITWDKKAIKQHFFPNELKEQQQRHSGDSPVNANTPSSHIARDLFGLSSDQSWMSYRVTIKKEHSHIERFKSPVTFKIIGNTVYFWADKSVEKILNKTFKISTKGNKPLDLSTPKEFSFDEFFEFVKAIDLSKHINQKFHQTNEFRDLTRILNGIRISK
jgi:hypothetical protein